MDLNSAEAQRWLTIAENLLGSRDFHGTRTFAIRARESAPLVSDQILAVTDTLLTAQANPNDWYGILQLVPLTQSMEVVASQYRKLAILLNPAENTLSFADQAFRFVSEAWNVLSNPSKKLIYDNELRFLQFGTVSQLNQLGQQQQQQQQHYHHPQQQQQQQQHPQQFQQPQTQMLFMQQPPQRETQTQVTQSLFVRSPSRSNNNKDGNAELGLNNTHPAEPAWTRQINQLGLNEPSQINQIGSVGSSYITWPEATRTSQINRPEPIRASQVNQSGTSSSSQFNLTESTRTGQVNHTATPPATAAAAMGHIPAEPTPKGSINHTASPPPAISTGDTQAEPTGVTQKTDSTRPNQATEPKGPSFWTACPYCYVLYEYPEEYVDCTLRCQIKDCRRPFHAAVIPSPPLNGKDTYFCSWGFYPLGCSGNTKNMGGKIHNWSPYSPMFTGSNNKNVGKQNNSKESAPKVFYDEHDVYVEISDSES